MLTIAILQSMFYKLFVLKNVLKKANESIFQSIVYKAFVPKVLKTVLKNNSPIIREQPRNKQ